MITELPIWSNDLAIEIASIFKLKAEGLTRMVITLEANEFAKIECGYAMESGKQEALVDSFCKAMKQSLKQPG